RGGGGSGGERAARGEPASGWGGPGYGSGPPTVISTLTAPEAGSATHSIASRARLSGKRCEKSAATASRRDRTRATAARKSWAVAQLDPSTSISFSGKTPERRGAAAADIPTTTTVPAEHTMRVAWASTAGSPVVSITVGAPGPPVQAWTPARTSPSPPPATV